MNEFFKPFFFCFGFSLIIMNIGENSNLIQEAVVITTRTENLALFQQGT